MGDNLIKRLEKATRPERYLDVEIAQALGAKANFFSGTIGYKMRNAPWVSYDTSRWISLPDFTSSLDDALRLVPEGCAWVARNHSGKPNHDGEGLNRRAFANVYRWDDADDAPLNPSWANTPAIALCIAVLRVRGA